MPLCAISPVHFSTGIAAVSDGWVVIVVDMMKWRRAFRVAPSSYRCQWLWWTSKVLMEAQGSPGQLLFLLSSRCKQHSHQEPSPSPFPSSSNFLFPWITFTDFRFALLLFAAGPCSVLIISAYSWHASLQRLSPSIMPALTSTTSRKTHPRLHLLSSYLLILLSFSIRPDCCHFSRVCPCFFLILSLSFHHRVPSVFLNPSRPWKTDTRHGADTSGDGAEVGWSAPLNHFAPQLLVKHATDIVAVDQEDLKPPPTGDLLDTGDTVMSQLCSW